MCKVYRYHMCIDFIARKINRHFFFNNTGSSSCKDDRFGICDRDEFKDFTKVLVSANDRVRLKMQTGIGLMD